MLLQNCKAFVFDMDGTLTHAVHDFDAIRRALELPAGVPILEALAALSEADAQPKWQRLEVIELDLAERATASPGAAEFLGLLVQRGCSRGILTRNSEKNTAVTLRAAGLSAYFDPIHLVTRDNAKPKPEPDGLLQLCARFGYLPSETAMIGDYLYDLECGRRAGAVTVHYAAEDDRRWPTVTDYCVASFAELAALIDG